MVPECFGCFAHDALDGRPVKRCEKCAVQVQCQQHQTDKRFPPMKKEASHD